LIIWLLFDEERIIPLLEIVLVAREVLLAVELIIWLFDEEAATIPTGLLEIELIIVLFDESVR
jgi:hypothetical protein